MTNYDLGRLYRSSVGFDRVFDLLETVSNKVESSGYPPYNIERINDEDYRITLAVAGFTDAEIEIEVHENELKVVASKDEAEGTREYLHQGIAARSFERRFQIAEHVKVTGASLANGLLNIELNREIPEAKRPRKIAINGNEASNVKVLNKVDAA